MRRNSRAARLKRKVRIRKRLSGVHDRPRMTVFRSQKHIYVQIVDDTNGRVLTSASSLSKQFRERTKGGAGVPAAKIVGEMIARKALQNSISQVVYDRSGYRYHGRVKALAEAAREQGLKF